MNKRQLILVVAVARTPPFVGNGAPGRCVLLPYAFKGVSFRGSAF